MMRCTVAHRQNQQRYCCPAKETTTLRIQGRLSQQQLAGGYCPTKKCKVWNGRIEFQSTTSLSHHQGVCRKDIGSQSSASSRFLQHQSQRPQRQRQQQDRRMLSTKTTTSTSVTSETTSGGATASSSSGSTTGDGSKRSFMEWYEEQLRIRPVFTKMVTGAFLWGLGDAVAQLVPQVAATGNDDNSEVSNEEQQQQQQQQQQQEKEPMAPSPQPVGVATVVPPAVASLSSLSMMTTFDYDWPRTMRAVIFGFALHAPTSHLHFNFLEWMTVRAGITGSIGIPIFKAFMEQFVYWSWISNSMYHGAMGAMQGLTPTQIYHRIESVLWETQKAQWIFWIPVQLLNFRFVPVRHQLNVVLLTSVVWTALLSAWYPPEKKNDNNDQDGNNSSNKDEDSRNNS